MEIPNSKLHLSSLVALHYFVSYSNLCSNLNFFFSENHLKVATKIPLTFKSFFNSFYSLFFFCYLFKSNKNIVFHKSEMLYQTIIINYKYIFDKSISSDCNFKVAIEYLQFKSDKDNGINVSISLNFW